MSGNAADPHALIEALNDWALRTDWVDWVEIGGSFGRGAGDALSDVDAGIGVEKLAENRTRVDEARQAIETFAPVAATLRQQLDGGLTHLICVYEDGRQLSLVVFDEEDRPGLPPQAIAAVDKSGRLSRPMGAERWEPDDATVHEWAFLAWIEIGDAARHSIRGRRWRALASLTAARGRLWQLLAAKLHLPYPAHGAVAVENLDATLPPGIEATHPAHLAPAELHRALTALTELMKPYTSEDLEALAETVNARLDLLAHRAGTRPEPPHHNPR